MTMTMSDYRWSSADQRGVLGPGGVSIPADLDNTDYASLVASGVEIAECVAPAPTVDMIVSERDRRLKLGFDYDFGDARGVHRIGTTSEDMIGWRDVTDYSNALIDLGDTQTTVAIVTDTGPTTVTAPEWQAVILHAAQLRQVLWEKSFEVQALSPIPEDYAHDSRWA